MTSISQISQKTFQLISIIKIQRNKSFKLSIKNQLISSLFIGLVSFMIRSASGNYRTLKCSLAFGIYGFINLTMRLLAIVDFYIPSLGMLDVLRHLQADRIPFTNPKLSKGYTLKYIYVGFALLVVCGFFRCYKAYVVGEICPPPLRPPN